METTKKRGVLHVRWYYHAIIIALLITLTLIFYNSGLGAIPFTFAAVYLGYLTISEYRNIKRSKRM